MFYISSASGWVLKLLICLSGLCKTDQALPTVDFGCWTAHYWAFCAMWNFLCSSHWLLFCVKLRYLYAWTAHLWCFCLSLAGVCAHYGEYAKQSLKKCKWSCFLTLPVCLVIVQLQLVSCLKLQHVRTSHLFNVSKLWPRWKWFCWNVSWFHLKHTLASLQSPLLCFECCRSLSAFAFRILGWLKMASCTHTSTMRSVYT